MKEEEQRAPQCQSSAFDSQPIALLLLNMSRRVSRKEGGGGGGGVENDGDPEIWTGTPLMAKKQVESCWSGATSRAHAILPLAAELLPCQQEPRRLRPHPEREQQLLALCIPAPAPTGKDKLVRFDGLFFSPGIFRKKNVCIRVRACVRTCACTDHELKKKNLASTVAQCSERVQRCKLKLMQAELHRHKQNVRAVQTSSLGPLMPGSLWVVS